MSNKIFIYIAFFIVCNFGFSQSTNQNYVKETIYANENNVSSSTSPKNIVTTTYLDGLGRTIQVVEENASPESGKSIVTHIEYEKNIGKIKDYLPFANSGTQFVTDAKTNTINFHTNLNAYGYLGKNNPYSEVRLEKRPDPRILETAAPGADWAMGNGHTIKNEYGFNNTDEVKKFNVNTTWDPTSESFKNSISDNGFYPKSTLHKTIVKNENWTSGKNNTTEEFKGVDGKVVLKRTYNFNEILNINEILSTYYAYDFHGNLAFVIPPLANGEVSEGVINTLCYQYIYDKKNRLIEKKSPQKDWEYIVYDKADRIILTGPVYSPFGNSSKGWIFSKYDDLSRVVYTGFYNAGIFSSTERKEIQTKVNNQTIFNETKQGPNSTLDGIAIRYSNNVFPTTSTHLLSINYYDDYNYPDAPTAFPVIETVASIQKPKGLQTGSWIRVVTTDAERKGDLSYTLYNAKYQPLIAYTRTSLEGYIQTDNQLIFNGNPIKSTTRYKKTPSDSENKITNLFTYDNQNRLLTQKQQIGSQPLETITSNVYDELGVLVTKNVGGTNGNLQKIDYKYNVRGWLTSINENLFHNNNTDYLFGYIINYNQDGFRVDSEKQYNGGISSILWKTKSDNKLRGYTFDYDDLNRLINAQMLRSYSGPGLFRKSEYQEKLSYDKNGNILTLYRTGKELGDLSVDQLNIIDELTYTYSGNRLMKVVDDFGSPDGFKDGTNTGNDYEYDSFGNIIKDNNKKISSIKYNHLNLPTEITFDTGKILYAYDAAGAKVKKVVQPTSGLAQTTEYINGFQYLNGQLQFFPHAEGYVKPIYNQNQITSYLYVYQYKDHLGNVRLSYADLNGNGTIESGSEILEENNYYPFGLKHQGYNEIANSCRNEEAEQYTFLDKEFEDSFGLNITETDFRHYDSALGRFNVMDALSEFSYSYTPYHYSYNNPVYWKDPSGLLSDNFINSIWNNSPNGQNTTWTNMGGFFVSNAMGSNYEFSFMVFYNGDVEETLPMMMMDATRGGGGAINLQAGAGDIMKTHVYSNSQYYQYHRDQMWSQHLDRIQNDLEYFGMAPFIGEPIDLINGGISLIRGDYSGVAWSLGAMIPFAGNGVSAFKITNKLNNVASTTFKPISNTVKASGDGIPNSVYNYTSKDGTLISKYFYNDKGKVEFQMDYRDRNSIFGVHGHHMNTPGSISSGHQNGHHVPFMLIPKKYL